jgi:serpin B
VEIPGPTARVLALVVAVGLAGCNAENELRSSPPPTALIETPAGELVRGEADPTASPSADTEDVGAAIAANNAFGLKLFGELTGGEDNLFLSPLSISEALTMVYAGARGETAEQMADSLELGELSKGSVHEAMSALDRSLPRSPESAPPTPERTFRLSLANALWVQASYGVESAFLETLARGYGAGMRGLDFVGSPDPSRELINAWAQRATKGRIGELLPPASIDRLTRLVITNAIHFDAAWEQPFGRIGKGPFLLLDGSRERVEMISRRGAAGFGRGDGYSICEVTYRGGEYSMLLIVPDKGKYEETEAQLSPEFLSSAVGKISEEDDVALDMPRFEFHSEFALKRPLQALGMLDAFNAEAADLSGINRRAREHGLHVSDVFHDAFVRVDEKGTEAAAATGAVVQAVSAPLHSLTVNRPFVFAIRARDNGAILFLGRVLRP